MKVRFGIKNVIRWFPNAGILVFKIKAADFDKFSEAVEQLRQVLPEDYKDDLVFEKR